VRNQHLQRKPHQHQQLNQHQHQRLNQHQHQPQKLATLARKVPMTSWQ
jgi:hypothetical protein